MTEPIRAEVISTDPLEVMTVNPEGSEPDIELHERPFNSIYQKWQLAEQQRKKLRVVQQRVFVAVDCKERLPEKEERYFTDYGWIKFLPAKKKFVGEYASYVMPNYWLEEQPAATHKFTEDDMRKCWYHAREHKHGFVDTAFDKFIESLTPKIESIVTIQKISERECVIVEHQK
jgi:hypothetical protein